MRQLEMVREHDGAVIDRVTWDGKGLIYETGLARDILEPYKDLDALWEKFSAWSNGYVSLLPADDPTVASVHLFTCREGDPKTGKVLHKGPCAGQKLGPRIPRLPKAVKRADSLSRYPAGKDPTADFVNRKNEGKTRDQISGTVEVSRVIAETAAEIEDYAAKRASYRGLAHILKNRLARLAVNTEHAPGEEVTFDPALFNVEGPRPAPGSRAVVVRPGYSMKRLGTTIPIEYPVVRADGETEPGKARWRTPKVTKKQQETVEQARAFIGLADEIDQMVRSETPHEQIADRLRARMQEWGFIPIAKAGEKIPYQRGQRYEVLGPAAAPGQKVHVVRPGYMRENVGREGRNLYFVDPVVQTKNAVGAHPTQVHLFTCREGNPKTGRVLHKGPCRGEKKGPSIPTLPGIGKPEPKTRRNPAPKKPGPPPPDQDLIDKARARQSRADTARAAGAIAASVSESLNDGRSLDKIKTSTQAAVRQLERRHGPDSDAARQARELAQIVENAQTVDGLDEAVRAAAEQFGVRVEEKAGEMVPFDPRRFKSLEPGVRAGQKVAVVRPAVVWEEDGTVVESGVVYPLSAEELETRNMPMLPASRLAPARFVTQKHAQQMQDRMLSEHPWTSAQESALSEYVGNYFHPMNRVLRGMAAPDSFDQFYGLNPGQLQELIRDAASAMRPTPEPIAVTRATGWDAFGLGNLQLSEVAEAAEGLKGRTFQDPGFLSTTTKREPPFASAGSPTLRLEVPAGTSAAYVKAISDRPQESEMILAPGTSFEVTGVERGPKGGVIVVGRVLPREGA